MLSNPSPGQRVLCWYRPVLRDYALVHGKIGVVEIVSRAGKGLRRNHGVLVDGQLYVVPAGHLRKVES